MEYKVNKPYPKVEVEAPNETYGLMILDNVGGMNSETSAICQYIYNHAIAGETQGLQLVPVDFRVSISG